MFAVRFGFDRNHLRRHALFGADEVDHTITTLVAGAAEPGRGTTVVVASASGLLTLYQTLFRLVGGDYSCVIQHRHMTPGGSHGIKILNRHLNILPRLK